MTADIAYAPYHSKHVLEIDHRASGGFDIQASNFEPFPRLDSGDADDY